MKRIPMFLFLTLGFALAAAAQPAPPVVVPTTCTITTTDLEGKMDGFAGIDPTTVSPALLAFLNANPPRSQYDQPGCDKHFGESFRICSCETCGARLEIRVRKCGTAPPQQNNDGYVIGVAPFLPPQRVAQGSVWAAGDPNEKTLIINLSAVALTQVLCGSHANFLDVYIQDDTIVDWMRLTVQHP